MPPGFSLECGSVRMVYYIENLSNMSYRYIEEKLYRGNYRYRFIAQPLLDYILVCTRYTQCTIIRGEFHQCVETSA